MAGTGIPRASIPMPGRFAVDGRVILVIQRQHHLGNMVSSGERFGRGPA